MKGDVKNYLVHDFLNDSSIVVGKDEMFNIKIKANSFVWLQFAPINNALTAIGLTNKYISSHPIKSINFENDVVFVKLAEGGDFKFFSENKINKIIADGTVVTNKLSNDGSIYTLDIKEFLKEVKIEIYL